MQDAGEPASLCYPPTMRHATLEGGGSLKCRLCRKGLGRLEILNRYGVEPAIQSGLDNV
jgi:hypothetical protein